MTENATQTGLDRSVVHRLVNTLTAGGFVTKDTAGHYLPGPELRSLANIFQPTLVEFIQPYLQRLADRHGGTAIVFLAETRQCRRRGHRRASGSRLPPGLPQRTPPTPGPGSRSCRHPGRAAVGRERLPARSRNPTPWMGRQPRRDRTGGTCCRGAPGPRGGHPGRLRRVHLAPARACGTVHPGRTGGDRGDQGVLPGHQVDVALRYCPTSRASVKQLTSTTVGQDPARPTSPEKPVDRGQGMPKPTGTALHVIPLSCHDLQGGPAAASPASPGQGPMRGAHEARCRTGFSLGGTGVGLGPEQATDLSRQARRSHRPATSDRRSHDTAAAQTTPRGFPAPRVDGRPWSFPGTVSR